MEMKIFFGELGENVQSAHVLEERTQQGRQAELNVEEDRQKA